MVEDVDMLAYMTAGNARANNLKPDIYIDSSYQDLQGNREGEGLRLAL